MLEVNVDNILPITAARDSFNKIIDEVEGGDELYLVTKNGSPAAIIVGVHHLEKLTGTSHKTLTPDPGNNTAKSASAGSSGSGWNSNLDDSSIPTDDDEDKGNANPVLQSTPAPVADAKNTPDKPIDFGTPLTSPSTNFVFDDSEGLKTTDGKPLTDSNVKTNSIGANSGSNTVNDTPVAAPTSTQNQATATPPQTGTGLDSSSIDNIFKPFDFDDDKTASSTPVTPTAPSIAPSTPAVTPLSTPTTGNSFTTPSAPPSGAALSPVDEPFDEDVLSAPAPAPQATPAIPAPPTPLSPAPSAGGMPLGGNIAPAQTATPQVTPLSPQPAPPQNTNQN
ncbi:MAG TPA: type II toxin-antitoxin system prevent-host-death family antitoxin [Candidatus Woesebacteria bacterium]|nr:type II toxin-antitoxin system prevent-host-death family antitoxin [Candidatus Woesebacteria bacterium]